MRSVTTGRRRSRREDKAQDREVIVAHQARGESGNIRCSRSHPRSVFDEPMDKAESCDYSIAPLCGARALFYLASLCVCGYIGKIRRRTRSTARYGGGWIRDISASREYFSYREPIDRRFEDTIIGCLESFRGFSGMCAAAAEVGVTWSVRPIYCVARL